MGFGFGLNFDVQQEVHFFAAFAPHFDQNIGVAPADRGIGGDLLEFGFEEGDGFVPVDEFGGFGEEELDGFGKVLVEDFLPGGKPLAQEILMFPSSRGEIVMKLFYCSRSNRYGKSHVSVPSRGNGDETLRCGKHIPYSFQKSNRRRSF